jgi:transporter family-2 protein
VYLFSNILSPGKIGLAGYFIMLLVGQLCTALVIDHFGAFGMPTVPASTPRVVGVMCSIVAALIIRLDLRLLLAARDSRKVSDHPG